MTARRTKAASEYEVYVDEARARARLRKDWTCPACDGKGVVREEAEAGYPVTRPCACRALTRRVDLFSRAGVPALFATSRLDTFRPGHASQETAHMAARTFAQQYVAGTRRGIVFTGPVGVGKTHLAAAIVRELTLEMGVASRFCDFVQLLHDLRTSYERREGSADLLEPLTRVDVLVIDDLGKGRGTDWELDVLDDLISRRYNAGLSVIATSNHLDRELSADEKRDGFVVDTLRQRVGVRIHSRLHGMCSFMEMKGEDYRRTWEARGRWGGR